ncbi:hypothetical protein GQ651_01765 [Alphaproteobacteria bacterium GH1-50]|uniref:Uncharacterized protein n=1 Tax=Kangsaoukella pontilimi TaxID=2691042 RepID=A0A7C9IE85_9RHOB|nr:hypothetical protein [Kangsaoukella pontilimi]MXQ06564.1 hypothetical protein [Kangsaoukella pontilimi]
MDRPQPPTLLIVAQAGRLTYEAVLFLASLRQAAPGWTGRVVLAEPLPGPLWPGDPGIDDDEARALLIEMGAEIRGFDSLHFGAAYPHGNKVEALSVLDPDEPFLFFDTDTLITGPLDTVAFDLDRPSASMAREGTWPEIQLYGPGYTETWRAIYDRFGVPFEPTLDLAQPDEHWERYLYFNAGWFYYRRAGVFRADMLRVMLGLRDDPLPELVCQSFDPWLDQVALPVVIAGLGGGRPGPELAGLDGDITWHWRALPLLYARASDAQLAAFEELTAPNRIKRVLKRYEPFRRMIYQNRGGKVRALFDQTRLPRPERALRSRIKRERLWLR